MKANHQSHNIKEGQRPFQFHIARDEQNKSRSNHKMESQIAH